MFAFEKLPGLPRDRIVEAIAPVLRAHGLAGVELIWRTDGQGRVLQVTLEKAAPESSGGEPADAGDPLVPGASSAPETNASEVGALEAASSAAASSVESSEAASQPVDAGVTLDVCSKVSRDLSTALDVLELIDGNYRLEVGSPGLERRLYTLAD